MLLHPKTMNMYSSNSDLSHLIFKLLADNLLAELPQHLRLQAVPGPASNFVRRNDLTVSKKRPVVFCSVPLANVPCLTVAAPELYVLHRGRLERRLTSNTGIKCGEHMRCSAFGQVFVCRRAPAPAVSLIAVQLCCITIR